MSNPPGLPAESRDSFWRSLQTLNLTRMAIAIVLLAYMVAGDGNWYAQGKLAYRETCALYLLAAAGFAMLTIYWRQRFLLQLMAQLALDLGVISLLYIDAGGVRSGLAILYLFPLAGAAILAPLQLAMFCAALVSLFMLGECVYQVYILAGERSLLQAGLYGAAFFAVVLVVSRLAARLIGQETLAAQRGNALAIQQAINRLIVADMDDGVIVVGRDGRLFTCNPAAQRMLGLVGLELDFSLTQAPALQPIAAAYADWLADSGRSVSFVTVKPYDDAALQGVTAAWSGRRELAAHLRLRFATVDTAGLEAERGVIFLQDVTAIENQAQQLKLASMGRLTASIAHEVRNPLSAIGHATALLGEDLHETVHKRLLKIVGDNVARVNRMVEDILQLSRKVQVQDGALALAPFLAELRSEFQETHALAADVLRLDMVGAPEVRFDPLHLREILLNLLNNASRYASGGPGSIHMVVVASQPRRMELHVRDDGPGISPEVRAHLFEPFYTTSSKGTGLGLYLARELCLNNGALLDYEYHFDAAGAHASGRFVITFGASS
ncbi:MAG TPA: two-component sensor histidine kinase [Janthinobacterium sp.]|nr:two-component sensor histidine kinase [Janthinobacterium sp.]